MVKAFLCLLILCGAAAGYWLYSEGKPPFGPKQKEEQVADKEKKEFVNKRNPVKSNPAPKKQIAASDNTIPKKTEIPVHRTNAKKSPKKKPDPVAPIIDLTATSFEDPFYHGYWDAKDWSFGGTFMSCDVSSITYAAFRRDLKAPSLEFVLTPGTVSGILEIQLKSRSNNTTTRLYFSNVGVRVSATKGKQRSEIARKSAKLYEKAGQKCQVKITSTGKRIIIYWNEKKLLSCNQPRSQSGQPLTIVFLASRGRYNISKMRIEGTD